MKKTRTAMGRKLRLSKETVRALTLSAKQLGMVAGGSRRTEDDGTATATADGGTTTLQPPSWDCSR